MESQPGFTQMTNLPGRVGCQEDPGEQDKEGEGQCRILLCRRDVV